MVSILAVVHPHLGGSKIDYLGDMGAYPFLPGSEERVVSADLQASLKTIATDAGVRVMHRPRKLGLGSAYEDAFRIGLADGSSLFVEMDADGSHLAKDLQSIVDAARGCDGLAIGSRYIRGGEIVGWPAHRWLLSWAANLYCRVLLGLSTRDCTSGYRCYTRALLMQIDLDEVMSQGYSFQIEMVHRTRRLGFPIVEVPIRFEDRVAGASKVSRGEVRRALWTVLRLTLAR